jgi:uncharacterized protein YhaN
MSEHDTRILESQVDELQKDVAYLQEQLDDANYKIEQMENGVVIIWGESRKWE